jgi:hypothetical protein
MSASRWTTVMSILTKERYPHLMNLRVKLDQNVWWFQQHPGPLSQPMLGKWVVDMAWQRISILQMRYLCIVGA